MSFVGKILVVLQLVLCICFMALAGAVSATHTNWKKATETAQKLAKETQQKLTASETALKKLRDDTDAQLKEMDAKSKLLDTQVTSLTGKVDTLTLENESLRTNNVARQELAGISAEDAKDRRVEAVTLRELYKKALEAKEVEFREKNKLGDTVFQQDLDLKTLRVEQIALLRENRKLKDVLVKHNLPSELAVYEKSTAAPPTVSGKILDTRKTKAGSEMVEISIGSDDGLLKGHQLDVYHSGVDGDKPKYLGKIRITDTSPDRAVGTVIQPVRNGIIVKGDNVTTKL